MGQGKDEGDVLKTMTLLQLGLYSLWFLIMLYATGFIVTVVVGAAADAFYTAKLKYHTSMRSVLMDAIEESSSEKTQRQREQAAYNRGRQDSGN